MSARDRNVVNTDISARATVQVVEKTDDVVECGLTDETHSNCCDEAMHPRVSGGDEKGTQASEFSDETDQDADEEARHLSENNALARVFDDVRIQSRASVLVEPARWEEMGLVPEHLSSEDFEMLVYDYIQNHLADEAQDFEHPKSTHRPATRMVGVPQTFAQSDSISPASLQATESTGPGSDQAFSADAEAEGAKATKAAEWKTKRQQESEYSQEAFNEGDNQAAVTESDATIEEQQDPFSHLNLPEGYRLVELEGEFVLVPDEKEKTTPLSVNCKHIAILMGAKSYYLYDKESMTDAYAHWSFLAAEDNKVATFVDCVREDSRIYPRPLAASSFYNSPFNFTEEEVDQTWDVVRISGEYPDIQRTIASNGDVYYFSTRYLNPPYAASLAQWDAVSRKMYL